MPISFDRVADIYDETRRMPDDVVDQVASLILAQFVPDRGWILEVGVGTGRIAIPLAQKGAGVAGIDISEKMLARLLAKSTPLELPIHVVRGDVTRLPFGDQSFQAVLAVHIFHLVDDLRSAVTEARRVLLPGGRLLLAGEQRTMKYFQELLQHTEALDEDEMQMFQKFVVRQRDHDVIEKRVTEYVAELGGTVAHTTPIKWVQAITCNELVTRIEQRVTSSLWNVPEEELATLVERLRSLLEKRFGPSSTTLHLHREFRLLVARFPE